MQTVARVIVSDTAGTLAEQIERRAAHGGRAVAARSAPIARSAARAARSRVEVHAPRPRRVQRHRRLHAATAASTSSPPPRESPTPAPWVQRARQPVVRHGRQRERRRVHVVRERPRYRLTPWHNDPVSDASGEAFYIRDEETGRFWSPTPLPARGAMPYTTRHGFGYSVFEYAEDGISHGDADVRRDRRAGQVRRRSSCATTRAGRAGCRSPGSSSWCSATHRAANLPHVVTEVDPQDRRAVRAQRVQRRVRASASRSSTAARRSAPSPATAPSSSAATAAPANPACMSRTRLSGPRRRGPRSVRRDAGDGRARRRPGARDRVHVRLRPRPRRRAAPRRSASAAPAPARSALEGVWAYWNRTLGAVHVQTPDPSLNFLANGWLLYQVLACRHVGAQRLLPVGRRVRLPRPAAGRDGAASTPSPAILREQILRSRGAPVPRGRRAALVAPAAAAAACARASPTTTCGCRTPSCRYVHALGDTGVLDEKVQFLDGRPVKPDEESYYDLPGALGRVGDALRALRARDQERPALRRARPAADGLRRLERRHEPRRRARQGRERLARVLPLRRARAVRASSRERRGDDGVRRHCAPPRRRSCARTSSSTRWDGEWYRRAYFDNGEPLGSASSPECQIDSLPQSWAVLSRRGRPGRARAGAGRASTRGSSSATSA